MYSMKHSMNGACNFNDYNDNNNKNFDQNYNFISDVHGTLCNCPLVVTITNNIMYLYVFTNLSFCEQSYCRLDGYMKGITII